MKKQQLGTYWIEIELTGGWVNTFKVQAKGTKDALKVGQEKFLNSIYIAATEDLKTALKRSR